MSDAEAGGKALQAKAPEPGVTAGPLAVPLPWDLVARAYTEQITPHFEKYAADALAFAELGATDNVLDIATGPGTLAVLASRIAARVTALDFSVAMVGECKQRIRDLELTNVQVAQADCQELAYPDAAFSAAFSMFGLMFFPDRTRAFKELYRVLAPGGRAVVSSWQPMSRVPELTFVFAALSQEMPTIPLGDGKGPLSDAGAFEAEMSAAGFQVSVHERIHSIEAPSLDAFWSALQRTMAPLVLLKHKLGDDRFAPVAAGIHQRLLAEFGPGPLTVSMPAWLALGRVPR